MRPVEVIVSNYDKIPYPVTVLEHIPGQGYRIQYEIPDKEDSDTMKLLKKIANKLGVE